jgi:hypothetical protein
MPGIPYKINLTSVFCWNNFALSLTLIITVMKTKKVIFLFGLFLLFATGLHSCEAIGCYSCKRTNNQGKTEKTSTCSAHDADQLRNEGWTCEGGW